MQYLACPLWALLGAVLGVLFVALIWVRVVVWCACELWSMTRGRR